MLCILHVVYIKNVFGTSPSSFQLAIVVGCVSNETMVIVFDGGI
jgi:hypothetical protein